MALTLCAPPSGKLILPADGLGSFHDDCVWVKSAHALDRLSLLAQNSAFALRLKFWSFFGVKLELRIIQSFIRKIILRTDQENRSLQKYLIFSYSRNSK